MSELPAAQSLPQRLDEAGPAGSMRFHVTYRVFDAVHRLEDVARMQRAVIAVMERCASSPRVVGHGMFADMRGGFVILDADTPDRLLEMFAGLQDVAALEVHPLARTESALRFLRGMLATEQLG